jgi:hypothetical protein
MAPITQAKTLTLAADIVRFVDESQPGWVKCEFVDAEGQRHTLIDKVPIFTVDGLNETSEYPRPGQVRCELITQMAGRRRKGTSTRYYRSAGRCQLHYLWTRLGRRV